MAPNRAEWGQLRSNCRPESGSDQAVALSSRQRPKADRPSHVCRDVKTITLRAILRPPLKYKQ
ncbi:hypothetical protein KGM_206633 [Danaus plexippus plexippus]|uniref:Uncharacterized protein n=1 Tax=Danaus plexippus plexippus TaxID=278856 RepID=A0A212FCA8_DANPL|nr:hypothetical protein KGM_206633 [Danaus plexippus plexippus]